MNLFRSTATGIGREQPAAPVSSPRQRRTDRADEATGTGTRRAAEEPAPTPVSSTPAPALRPPAAELVRRLVGTLATDLSMADPEDVARLTRHLNERIAARVAGCRDAVIAGRLGGVPGDQRARLRATGPTPGQIVEQMGPELDQATLLALLNEPTPGPTTTVGARLVEQLGRLQPSLTEAVLDALYSPTILDRFDRRCRMHYARAFSAGLSTLALAEVERDAAQQALALEDDGQQGTPPQHRDADEVLLLERLRRGDNRGAIQVLAAAALVPVASVEAAITLRSRRGIVSLAWKAGYSMRAAVLMQSQLAGIAPDRVLVATADGGCPLSRGEILWQIGFLARRLG